MTDKSDRDLFDEVFLPHLAEAYRLARWLTGSAADAEDVVQDAALRAFRGIRGYGALNARAWSLTIVRNAAYSWLLKNRSRHVVFTEDLSVSERQQLEQEGASSADNDTPEEIMLHKAEAAEVQRALDKLPAPYREIVVLRELHELGYRDIAEIAGIPIGTVMSRLSRARKLLMDDLRDTAP
ncbi:MAG: sigma-70 family RNA polymerase sigma factor [Pseudomonadota bacterium]